MPTPYGSRGGMAFSADELRVLRRALAIALQPHPVTLSPGHGGPDRTEEVQDCLRLAEAVDEAVREGGRLRAFLLDELARYRAALPGAAVGYLDQLEGVLAAGYEPLPEDLAALRALCRSAAGTGEAERRRALLRHCERLAERGVRARLAERAAGALWPRDGRSAAVRLRVLPGGAPAGGVRAVQKSGEPAREPRKKPSAPERGAREEPKRGGPAQGEPKKEEPEKGEPKREEPKKGEPGRAEPTRAEPTRAEPTRGEPKRGEPGHKAPRPGRPVPTPAEVFPPKRRRPAAPPDRDSRLGRVPA
ncbi:hypothetical protein [Streptomyces lonegramiae]|uniref:Uncharacterized protein n=1 Tax=Streptomyces lonegramiae TaxID=3075524 RepID=A0ABU2XL94_9ACTN|nr:hypothetical protein [Streptomyces sp. DSM 41529]MDT0546694.1 hypothetical protein [Streptomyces sp. DSM 41529]